MPGLLGIAQIGGAAGARGTLSSALARMDRGAPVRTESMADPEGRWALARVHLGVLHPEPQLGDDRAQIVALFHGDLGNAAALRSGLEASAGGRSGVGALVAGRYERDGEDFAARLEGAFCAAVLDRRAGRLLIATDRLGTYPLYWYRGEGFFAFASELKALLAVPGVERRLDLAAAGDFLRLGFVLGRRSLAAGVELLDPGTVLIQELDGGAPRLERYFHPVSLFTGWNGTREAYRAEVVACFGTAVERCLEGDHRFVLSVSGGLDSRAILSAASTTGRALETYTNGVPGCADEVIARRLAAIAGTRHRFYDTGAGDPEGFLDGIERLVVMSEGMYLTHGFTELNTLARLEEAGHEVLLRGHGGELAKTSLAWPLHTDARVMAMGSTAELVPYLLARVSPVGPEQALAELLTPECYEALRGSTAHGLRASLDGLDLLPAQACAYLYLVEHHRRFTVASLEIFREALEVRMPFADIDLLGVLLAGDPAWRADTGLHRAIIEHFSPPMARVRNSNTGAPANAGLALEFVLDKLNSLLLRLDVPGYRHYHSFDAWMQHGLVARLAAVMLDERTLERGLFRPEALRRIIERTAAGEAGHSYQLQAALVVELWQRRFLEA